MSLFPVTIPARNLTPGMRILPAEHPGQERLIRAVTPLDTTTLMVDYHPIGGRTVHPDQEIHLA